jgi:DNA gyrase subunit A
VSEIFHGNLVPVSIAEEMKRSYLDYAMSVIVSRALPDVRDGLKPVHRRILYAMNESGCYFDKPYRKSARIVGEVMGKYHPHGDSAIYDSLVRMAQDFSLRLPLIDGQGNFGSMDGDSAAAMRYTESRLAKVSHSLLEDIDFDTVEFHPNYDGSEREPDVLPSRFPNLLVNGAGGIAVGMATNIPPHNLGELIDACIAYTANSEITIDEIAEIVKGPDFPTGGIILGHAGIHSAIRTGRGSVIMRGRTNFETLRDNKNAIIITEIPYQVNKAKLVEKIAELVRDKRVEGISNLRDESNKNGVRVVVELKRDAIADVVLNQLYSYTQLQTSFGVNMLALHNNQPKLMNVLDVLKAFVEFREEVITRRTIFLLGKARDRAHLLIGMAVAVANIDEVITLIRNAKDPVEAREALLARKWHSANVLPLIRLVENNDDTEEFLHLTEAQARAILEMRLQRLTGLEHQKIHDELNDIAKQITEYREILNSRARLIEVLTEELLEIKTNFATPRRTDIDFNEFEHDIEDLIPQEDMVVTVTMGGYIKRVPLSTYRAQRRGGKGRSSLTMHEEDAITQVFVANTHTSMLFFSTTGKVYRIKVYKLPLGSPQAKGRALVNIFPLDSGETINNVLALPQDKQELENLSIVFATASGNIRRNDVADFSYIPSNGKIAMKLDEGDSLIDVKLCKTDDHIMLSSNNGKAVRFPVEGVRVFKSRASDGVRGMKLAPGDRLISMSILNGIEVDITVRDEYLSIPLEDRIKLVNATNEEVQNIINNLNITIDTDTIMDMASKEQFLLTITENGYGKRSSAYEYRTTSRGTQGITNIITSTRNGGVVSSYPVDENDQLMLITDKGTLIRIDVTSIRIIGRNTQGVKLINTSDSEIVVGTAHIADNDSNDSDDNEIDDSESENNNE